MSELDDKLKELEIQARERWYWIGFRLGRQFSTEGGKYMASLEKTIEAHIRWVIKMDRELGENLDHVIRVAPDLYPHRLVKETDNLVRQAVENIIRALPGPEPKR